MNSTTTHAPIDPAIRFVLDTNPDLSIQGWRKNGMHSSSTCAASDYFLEDRAELYSPESQKQIATAIAFCLHVTLHPKATSYSIKHAMEEWGRTKGKSSYISNGCAIVGAMVYGYTAVRIKNSLNCYLRGCS